MISELTLENFRNFTEKGLSFTERTAVTGVNGSGKSTLLEAIRVLSVGKSSRTSHLEELLMFNKKFCRVKAIINNQQEAEFFYGNQFETQGTKDRRLTFQGNIISWIDFLGVFPTVLFTPNDLEIVLGAPEIRRRYFDSILWQVSIEYRQKQLEFSRVLRERAALLFMIKIHRASANELQPWNELIGGLTKNIRAARMSYVDYLNNKLTTINSLVGAQASPEAQNQPLDIIGIEYRFDNRPVERVAAQEIKTAQNIFGAHRDEVIIKFDDYSARRFASRGQSRLTVAHLKAVEADYLSDKTGNPVTVLLDDSLSELDYQNTDTLLKLFNEKHQLILTSAGVLNLPKNWKTIKL